MRRIGWRRECFQDENMTRKPVAAHEKRKWVRLTSACNNRCLFCLDADSLSGKYGSLGEVESALRAGRAEGCRRVVLSGGEPTIHPDFVEVVGLARELGYAHIQTITNGRMFCYDRFLKRAVRAGMSEATFSVHGASAPQHDLLAGVPGAFAQTLLGISNAKKIRGLIVSSDIVVNRINVDSLLETITLLHRMGVDEYDLLHLIPFGRAWENWAGLSYDPMEKKDVFNRVFRFSESVGAHLWTNRFPASLLEGNERYIQHPDKIMDEVRGMRVGLNGYLRSGKKMSCKGPRCGFCVMEQFCSDLRQLRAAGSLSGVPVPACLPGKSAAEKRVFSDADVMDVAEFYIRERMTVKAAACSGCGENGGCRGARIKTVMRKGFSALKPAGKA